EPIGRRDHFFALGGHSLLVMRLIAMARERNLPPIEPGDLFLRPRLYDLAAHLVEVRPDARDHAVCMRQGRSQPPLFLPHDGTGSLNYLHTLAAALPAGTPIYGLPSSALDETPIPGVEALASRMVGMIRDIQPEGPYRLAGWSTGGVIAYEIASQLLGVGEEVSFLGLFDAVYAAGLSATAQAAFERAVDTFDEKSSLLQWMQTGEKFRTLDIARLRALAAKLDQLTFAELVRVGNEESLLPADLCHLSIEQLGQSLWRRHGYLKAQVRYRAARIPIPIHLFRAQDSAIKMPCLGWERVAGEARISVLHVPGDHHSMMIAPNIGALADALSSMLENPADSNCDGNAHP
ncbi:thioesterase domain-containing protein, partial [Dyella flagellata]